MTRPFLSRADIARRLRGLAKQTTALNSRLGTLLDKRNPTQTDLEELKRLHGEISKLQEETNGLVAETRS